MYFVAVFASQSRLSRSIYGISLHCSHDASTFSAKTAVFNCFSSTNRTKENRLSRFVFLIFDSSQSDKTCVLVVNLLVIRWQIVGKAVCL